MKNVSLKLNVPETKKQFDSLFSVINRTTVLPILENIRIVQNGSLQFMGNDLENYVVVTKESQSKDEFDFCIDSTSLKPFFDNKLADEFSIIGNEEKVCLESSGFKVNVTLAKKLDQYPVKPVFESGITEKINSAELCKIFEKAIIFLSTDDLRPAMTGVYLCDWKDMLYVVATDAHRLFFKPVMKTPPSFKGLGIVIPRKAVKLFIQMFKNEELEIKIDKFRIFFCGKEKELVSRLIDAKYPNFSAVLVSGEYKFSLQRKQLNSFIKIAIRFTHPITHQTILTVDNEGISFTGGDIDYDIDFSYKLPIYNPNKKIEKFYFGVNINFLQDALSVNKKDEYVYFEHMGNPTKGFVIDDCVLMMPLMLKDNF